MGGRPMRSPRGERMDFWRHGRTTGSFWEEAIVVPAAVEPGEHVVELEEREADRGDRKDH